MNMKKAYVIGTNVSTSLSPAIFEHWFKKYNVDAEYGFIEIKKENFDGEIKSILAKEDLVGLNVTMPFKERIIPYLTSKNNGGMEEFYNPLAKKDSELVLEAHYVSEVISDISHIKKFQKERLNHFKKLNKETITINNQTFTTYKCKMGPTGILGALWKAHIWLDVTTGLGVDYNGPVGLPGSKKLRYTFLNVSYFD